MCTPAQILANQSNAQHATGPVTAAGKATVSRNAVKLGLFSATAFVRPGEQEEFDLFTAGYRAELTPQTPLEETLSREIVHAAWRLRRCAQLEANPPADRHEGADRPPLGRPLCAIDDEELDRLQTSIDRARSSAQRSLHRSLAELRRVQTERVYRAIALPQGLHPENPGQASCRQLDPPALFIKQVQAADAQLMKDVIESYGQRTDSTKDDFAKQTQFRPAAPPTIPVNVPRSAPCPCGSGQKYKRCCGKTAPPVLSARAA